MNEVNEMVLKFYLAHGFSQCLVAVDGSHVNIKKPKRNANDYMNLKGHYSFNVQAAANYQYISIFFYNNDYTQSKNKLKKHITETRLQYSV